MYLSFAIQNIYGAYKAKFPDTFFNITLALATPPVLAQRYTGVFNSETSGPELIGPLVFVDIIYEHYQKTANDEMQQILYETVPNTVKDTVANFITPRSVAIIDT